MRIALFDWVSGGHHALYARRFIETLDGWADIVLAAPDKTIAELTDLDVSTISLGERPLLGQRLSYERYRVAAKEAMLLERVAAESRADHIIHLYADAVIPGLLRRPRLKAQLSLLLFYPWSHYPRVFGSRLSPGERARAFASEALTTACRNRDDVSALMTLDEEAARRWRHRRGAPSYWIPEPPVSALTSPTIVHRTGCILYGSLGERKGVDLLAAAVALEPTSVKVTIAGEAHPEFSPALHQHVARMRTAGADVEVHPHRHSECDGLKALASARCAVLPYPRHTGMSRILVEACAVGTPVVVNDWGLLGHLVRRHGIGLAVNCRDAWALRKAILELSSNEQVVARYRSALARFASRYSAESFGRALRAPFVSGDVHHGDTIDPVLSEDVAEA